MKKLTAILLTLITYSALHGQQTESPLTGRNGVSDRLPVFDGLVFHTGDTSYFKFTDTTKAILTVIDTLSNNHGFYWYRGYVISSPNKENEYLCSCDGKIKSFPVGWMVLSFNKLKNNP